MRGSTYIKNIKGEDVGKINGIILRGQNQQPYRCSKIRLENGPKSWNFDCEGAIQCPNACK